MAGTSAAELESFLLAQVAGRAGGGSWGRGMATDFWILGADPCNYNIAYSFVSPPT